MTRDVIGLKGERETYAGVVSGSDIKMMWEYLQGQTSRYCGDFKWTEVSQLFLCFNIVFLPPLLFTWRMHLFYICVCVFFIYLTVPPREVQIPQLGIKLDF